MPRTTVGWYGVALHAALVVLAALTLLLTAQNRRLRGDAPPPADAAPEVGDVLPPVDVRGLDGDAFSLAFAERSRPTVVLAFTTTCPVCSDSWADWRNLYDRLHATHDFVAVGLDDAEAVRREIASREPPFPVVLPDDPRELGLTYGIRAVPMTFLVAPGGEVRRIELGRLDLADW